MIEKLAELNRILIATTELSDDNGADVASVVRHASGVVIEGRIPDHEVSIAFAQQIGFISRDGNHLRLTEEGRSFLSLNPDRVYDLSIEQRRLLIRATFLHGPLRSTTLAFLKSFAPAFADSTYRWSAADGPPLPAEGWFASHVEELGIVRRDSDGLVVTPEFVPTVASFIAEGKGFTDEDFEAWLREKKEIGELAERLIFDFEVSRLKTSGRALESHCVRRISKLKVDAGYDIESYDSKAPPDLNYNRFIEVKGSRGPQVRFFWSENEIKAAKKLGAGYWIYFQGGIDLKAGVAKNKPLLFQNPAETILKDGRFELTPHGVLVQGGMRGDVVTIT